MMRRLMICFSVLAISGILPSLAQLPTGTQTEESPAGNQAGNQKVIRDPAEYDAYLKALNLQNPAQRAAAMETFVASYPGSVVREDALEQAMTAYEQAGKTADVEKVARRILEIDANHARALAIVVALTRIKLAQGQQDLKPANLRITAKRGLQALEQWEMPAGMAQNEFEKLQKQMRVIFYGGMAFAALQEKDYAVASHNYSKALKIDPDDMVNTYQLSIADLEMTNPDVRGFWYVARAIHLAEKQHSVVAVNSMAPYGQAKYRKYHGGMDGWDGILSRAAGAAVPPRDFTVERAPAASLTSASSPGSSHSTPASALSSATTSAGIASPAHGSPRGVAASVLSSGSDGTGNGVSASLLSSGSPGTTDAVPASVLSSQSSGAAHRTQASITSSTAEPSARLVRFGRAHHALVPVPIFLQIYH